MPLRRLPRPLRPLQELFRILQDVVRDGVVGHGLVFIRVRTERRDAAGFEIGSVLVVGAQQTFARDDLAAANRGLQGRKLEPIKVSTLEEWRERQKK